MMTYEASEQLVMNKLMDGSYWEFYIEQGGAFYWIASDPSKSTIDMWRVGPRGGIQIVLSATPDELTTMQNVYYKRIGVYKAGAKPLSEFTPEEHDAKLHAEINAIKKGLGL